MSDFWDGVFCGVIGVWVLMGVAVVLVLWRAHATLPLPPSVGHRHQPGCPKSNVVLDRPCFYCSGVI